jgi:glutamate transport system substrate-binding protein
MKARRFGVAAGAVAVMLGLAACGGDDNDTGGGDGGGGGGDTITIGIKVDQPGLGLQEGSEYTGFDVDVATYVANELGYSEDQIEFVQAPTPQRESLIESGQVDLVVATYSITDERAQRVTFAGPYFIAGQDLLVRQDDDSIQGPEDMEGKNLCSVQGSTSAQNVKDEYPGTQLQEFPTYSECVTALVADTVDALTTDDTILAGYAAQDQYAGQLKVVGQTFSEERYGIGMTKGDTDTCEQVNDAITKMIDDGSWDDFVDANFGAAGYVPSDENPPTPDPCA